MSSSALVVSDAVTNEYAHTFGLLLGTLTSPHETEGVTPAVLGKILAAKHSDLLQVLQRYSSFKGEQDAETQKVLQDAKKAKVALSLSNSYIILTVNRPVQI